MLRLVRWILTPLIILGLLFVGANVVVQHVAESTLAGAIEDAFHLPTKPTVEVGGFPIIVDLLRGRIPRVSFTASGADIEGLKIDEITVVLTDVGSNAGFLRGAPAQITVKTGTVTGRATQASVNAYLAAHSENATLTFHQDSVVVRAVRVFLGARRTFVATGTIAREGKALVFRPTSVTIDGHPPPPGTGGLARQKATVSVALPELPGGVASYRVEAVEGGLAITAVLNDATVDLSA
ncbi:MAG: LmeA family phospholipid-binding protein [Actinomycetota bacterium]